MPKVLRQVHGGHAARADLTIEAVAGRKSGLEPSEQVGHVEFVFGMWVEDAGKWGTQGGLARGQSVPSSEPRCP
jgi:hypothetical protein